MQAPYIMSSVCDRAVLETFLWDIQNKVDQYNKQFNKDSILRVAPVQWIPMARMLRAAIRDDAVNHIAAKPDLRPPNKEADHIFEVQYFVAVFLHTVAERININIGFQPDISDIQFALTIINSSANLCPLTKTVHKFKSAFFRAAEQKPNPEGESDPARKKRISLQAYLESAVNPFVEFVQVQRVAMEAAGPQAKFRTMLLENILRTPWCNKERWGTILYSPLPFSKNVTFDNCVPNPWVNDNLMYETMLAECKRGKPKDENWDSIAGDKWGFDVAITGNKLQAAQWDVLEGL